MKYQRLVEIYVKPELRAEIKKLKNNLTYDQYLEGLIQKEKKANPARVKPDPMVPKPGSKGGHS